MAASPKQQPTFPVEESFKSSRVKGMPMSKAKTAPAVPLNTAMQDLTHDDGYTQIKPSNLSPGHRMN